MKPLPFRLCDGSTIELNTADHPELEKYLWNPKAQVKEMIRQINVARYYDFMFPKPGLTFLDLGANLGMVSLFATPRCERVIAVECDPAIFEMLFLLLKPHQHKSRLLCLPYAVTPNTGKVSLSLDREDYTCSTLSNPKPGNKLVKVDGICLPDLFVEYDLMSGVDVCKVDIEGAEMEILTENAFKSLPVKLWYIEVHKTPKLTRDQSRSEMMSRLKLAGFHPQIPRDNAIIARRKS